MSYVSITCVIAYVIGHALGPSRYPRPGSLVSLPPSHTISPRNFRLEPLGEAPGRAGCSPEMAPLPTFLLKKDLGRA